MTFLPIVSRELRVAARRRSTFLGRVVAAGVALVVAAWMFLTIGSASFFRPQMGTMIFGSLTFFAFVYCLLIGTRVTADCLSEEKRDGTLGLLFLTDLKGYDVVIGKLVANSLNAFYGLLAIFPVMAIPVLLGGVSGTDLIRTSALLVNTLFFSLAAGMFASAVAQNERKALGLTVLVIAVVSGGLPLLGVWWTESVLKGQGAAMPAWSLLPSPCAAYSSIKVGTGSKFWMSLGVTHAISWALLVAACVILPRSWQDKANTARAEQRAQRSQRLVYGSQEKRAQRRRQLMEIHPIVWLCSRNKLDAALLWYVLIIAGVVWLGCALRWPDEWFEEWVYVLTAIAAHLTIKFWVASQAVRQIAEDRRTGALELLLSTSLTHQEIVRGHLRALKRLFAGPIAVVMLMDASFAFACGYQGMPHPSDNWVLFWLFLGSMGTLVADAWAISWLGLWFGLTMNRANRASGAAIWRVVFLPGIVMWFGLTCVAFASVFRFGGEPETMLVLWFVLSFINAGVWYAFAERRLMDQFRTAAAKRFDAPKPGWIKQMFSRGDSSQPPVITAPQ
jgi:ABC-type transport system involved in cytochrome c biogenesis permease component